MKKLLFLSSFFGAIFFSWAVESSKPSDYIDIDYIAEQYPSVNKEQLLIGALKNKKTASELPSSVLREFLKTIKRCSDVVIFGNDNAAGQMV